MTLVPQLTWTVSGTYWVNPATPAPMCHLMITRMNDDICQIKLELDVFEISGPNAKGECAEEFFLVSGGSPVPALCGINNQQHIIYSVTPDSGPSQLSIILSVSTVNMAVNSNARLWNIRIYQYECVSPVLAPVGCLQYYFGASGIVQRFNYKLIYNKLFFIFPVSTTCRTSEPPPTWTA